VDKEGSVGLVDAETGNPVRTLAGGGKGYSTVKFSGDGRRVAAHCYGSKQFQVWDVSSGLLLATFSPPEDVNHPGLSISNDGRMIAGNMMAGAKSTVLYTWDVDAKTQLARIEFPQKIHPHNVAMLSPDGRFLAAGGVPPGVFDHDPKVQSEVFVWDAHNGRVVHSLPGHMPNAGYGTFWCNFSPSGQMLFTGDSAGKLKLWEVLSGQEMYGFPGHKGRISWGSISPDGRLLLSASEDAPCFIWDIFGSEKQPLAAMNPGQLWRDLADKDAKKAFLAIRELVARPAASVDLIRQSLKPIGVIDDAKIEKLLKDLGSLEFAIREAATVELMKYTHHIEAWLNKARAAAPLEVRTRIDTILDKAGQPTPERLRESRAVGILEIIATPAAAQVLGEFAAGSKYSTLTAEASAARERLKARGVK
jgi:WD40 repeat protein